MIWEASQREEVKPDEFASSKIRYLQRSKMSEQAVLNDDRPLSVGQN